MNSLDIRFGFVMFTALNWFSFVANGAFGLFPHAVANAIVAVFGMWALKRLPDYERTL